MTALTRMLTLPLSAIALLAAAGCEASGPTLGIRNDSDCTIKVRFWIGDRGPGPVDPADIRGDEVLEVRPGDHVYKRINEQSAYRSESESYVRLQVEPIGTSFSRNVHYWLEVNPPAPYIVRVFGYRQELRFERAPTTSTLSPVPRELWPIGDDLNEEPAVQSGRADQ